ncbi:arylsulfatase A-like enzyme [Algoriphagus ratkowskyi]|uniref:Sulfatase n=1 Tax=Algoriphagus ratkowskyi TaxID=57028 RepID=A0A2W7RLT1_9BACT|nr:sulfatase [Algoriphagus ratkowskyi]PZX55489.1 arylsulfatase A-like enzyme [Algoriphagus ratkowskyi]TXD79594.1 sulfatase [Algoriphagus ratkowskyi]
MLKKYIPIAGLLLCGFQSFAQSPEQPNIVFILVDDLGYHDLSVTGSAFYETPYINALASQSYQFSQGYSASPVCSPARASIMTGVTPAIHNITDWIGAPEGEAWRKYGRHTKLLPPTYDHALDPSYVTLPEALKGAGYETFFAGKWHLGGEGSYPEDHGFDTNRGGYSSGSPIGGYFAPYDNPKMEQGPDGENLSMRLANETAKFIEGKHEKPFFAMLSFYAVHGPIQTTEEKWRKYRTKAIENGLADHGYSMERRLPIRQVQDNPIYAGLVESMDDAVGVVLEALRKQGMDENTIVVFTSDHGGVASGDNFSTSNLPLRGGKGYQWEGGLRVPYFIKVPGQKEMITLTTPASGIDFYPTLLELAGVAIGENVPMEGVSLAPAMDGKEMADRALYWHYPHYGNQGGDPSSIIREGDWKLIYYWEDKVVELYDLGRDPGEQKNLASENRDEVKRLSGKLMQWLDETNANRPIADPDYDAVLHQAVLDKNKNERMPDLESERVKILAPGWQPNADWWGSKVTKD